MSHITRRQPNKEQAVRDLKIAAKAAARCRGTLDVNAKQFQAFGNSRPRCDAKITFPNHKYEIGLIKQADGSFELQADFWDNLAKFVGKDYETLLMFNQMETARKEATNRGYVYSEKLLGENRYEVKIDTTVALGV